MIFFRLYHRCDELYEITYGIVVQSTKIMDLQNASELMEPNFEQYNILLRNSNSNVGLPTAGDVSSTHHTHQLVSTNSFELNTGTSISENSDSGLPHTNSSISSGDSIRIGLCKFEFEVSHINVLMLFTLIERSYLF